MRLKWGAYFYDLLSSILRHMGTALTGWGGVNVANAVGVNVPTLNFEALGIFLISAGIIPAVASFWQKTPLPEIDTESTTETVTKTTSKSTTTNPPKT